MKRSKIVSVVLLGAYLVFGAVVLSSVSEASGANSVAFFVAVAGLSVGLILLVTHKSVDAWLKSLDQ
jgi:hypothetical protein